MMPDARNTCAIIVTYQPGPLDALTEALAAQTDAIFVVDNGSETPPRSCGGKMQVLLNGSNLGIAAALNRGLARAAAEGYRFALTMDQDSVPAPYLLETLGRPYREWRSKPIAVVGTSFTTGALPAEASGASPAWVEKQMVITSGSLMPLRAYQTIGPFRDDLFIDHVDSEYCLRARQLGYAVLRTASVAMTHHIGNRSETRILGIGFPTSNHSAVRRYYQARNLMYLARTYCAREPVWVAKALFGWARSCTQALCFEAGRRDKLGAALRGAADGLSARRFRGSTQSREAVPSRY